jgi:hypothetical protein
MAVPLLLLTLVAPLAQAATSAKTARFAAVQPAVRRWAMYATVMALHILQPLARLRGRLRHGLTIWRQRGSDQMAAPFPRTYPIWVGRWRAPEEHLKELQAAMKALGAVVRHGGDYDGWDLEVRGGPCGSARLLMAFEDSGSGTQLVRTRSWPHCHWVVWAFLAGLASVSAGAGVAGAFRTGMVFGSLALLLLWRIVHECGRTTDTIRRCLLAAGLLTRGEKVPRLEPEQEQA